MRSFIPMILMFLIGAALAAEPAADAAAPEPTEAAKPQVVAVLPCEAGDLKLLDVAKAVPELLSSALSRNKAIEMVEREQLNKAVDELELGASGLIDPDNAARIGKLIGARLLVTTRAYSVGDTLFVSAKVINAETGRVKTASKSTPLRANVNAGLLVNLISGDVQNIISGDIGKVSGSEDDELKKMITDLQKALEGKRRPTVTVIVPEEIIRKVVPDPAVKTELCYILRKLKFKVLENDSPLLDQWVKDTFAGKAARFPAEVGSVDLVIHGGAFAETVGNAGNLISSRARVELSAIQPGTGEILSVTAKTASGADLSEAVAGKTALEKATRAAAKDFILEIGTTWTPAPAGK